MAARRDPAERLPATLAMQLGGKIRDADWVMANFAFVANVTTLSHACDLALSPAMSVVSCRAFPQIAMTFFGDSPDLLANYATFLADVGSEVDFLVNEAQRQIVEAAFDVLSVQRQWQLVFRGDPDRLDVGQAVPLSPDDLPAIQNLARVEKHRLEPEAELLFDQGPAFGVWERRKLAAVATVSRGLPGAAQIGNIVVRREYRQRGYDVHVVSALVRALLAEQIRPFVIVPQEDTACRAFFEALGFVRERPMYLMHCVLKESEREESERERY